MSAAADGEVDDEDEDEGGNLLVDDGLLNEDDLVEVEVDDFADDDEFCSEPALVGVDCGWEEGGLPGGGEGEWCLPRTPDFARGELATDEGLLSFAAVAEGTSGDLEEPARGGGMFRTRAL